MTRCPELVAHLEDRYSTFGLLFEDGAYDVEAWRVRLDDGGRTLFWNVRVVRRHDGHVGSTTLAPSLIRVRELMGENWRAAWGLVHPGREGGAWEPANVGRDHRPTREVWALDPGGRRGPLQ